MIAIVVDIPLIKKYDVALEILIQDDIVKLGVLAVYNGFYFYPMTYDTCSRLPNAQITTATLNYGIPQFKSMDILSLVALDSLQRKLVNCKIVNETHN